MSVVGSPLLTPVSITMATGGGGAVCKWRAVRREKPARCVIAAKQQQQQTALPVCWRELPYLLLYQYREATESISSQIHQVIVS